MTEDGTERDNVIDHNVVIGVTGDQDRGDEAERGKSGACFWFEGGLNRVTRNVAANCWQGYLTWGAFTVFADNEALANWEGLTAWSAGGTVARFHEAHSITTGFNGYPSVDRLGGPRGLERRRLQRRLVERRLHGLQLAPPATDGQREDRRSDARLRRLGRDAVSDDGAPDNRGGCPLRAQRTGGRPDADAAGQLRLARAAAGRDISDSAAPAIGDHDRASVQHGLAAGGAARSVDRDRLSRRGRRRLRGVLRRARPGWGCGAARNCRTGHPPPLRRRRIPCRHLPIRCRHPIRRHRRVRRRRPIQCCRRLQRRHCHPIRAGRCGRSLEAALSASRRGIQG
jgi:hypothetical protein